MEPPGSPSRGIADINEDLIGSATPMQEIINVLTVRGCSNLTLSIDLAACSVFPRAGGGFCDVFRGALHDNTMVAIKCLRVYDGSEAEGDGEQRKVLKRAARELYHWSKLKHPNVLPLLGLAVFRGHLSMVSEWMRNGSMIAYLRLNPGANRKKLCMEICEGLCYIHRKGMAHGDLKAANVMVSSDGIALIADFGNAQLKDLTLRFTTTRKGGLSIRWAAPELLLEDNGPQFSKEADVYAYGMTVLEVLTGKVPYNGTGDRGVFRLVAFDKKPPPRPEGAETGVCDDLWRILNSCWSHNASERPGIISIHKRLQHLFLSYGFDLERANKLLKYCRYFLIFHQDGFATTYC